MRINGFDWVGMLTVLGLALLLGVQGFRARTCVRRLGIVAVLGVLGF